MQPECNLTVDMRYPRLARQTFYLMLRDYWNDNGFLDVPRQAVGPGLDNPHVPVQDAPTPAANAVAAAVLLRLSRILGAHSYRSVAERPRRELLPARAPHGLCASTLPVDLDHLLHVP